MQEECLVYLPLVNVKQLRVPERIALHGEFRLPRAGADLWAVMALCLLGIAGLLVAFAPTPTFVWQTLGNPAGGQARQNLFLENFYPAEPDTARVAGAFRHWSSAQSGVNFQGVGRGWWQATLVLSGPRASHPPPLVTLTTGRQATTIRLAPQPRHYILLTSAPSGDWSLRLQTTTWSPRQADPKSRDSRMLGILLHDLNLIPVLRQTFPPPSGAPLFLAILLLCYATLRLSGLRPLHAVILPVLLLGAMVVGLEQQRIAWGLFVPRLCGAALVGMLAVLVARAIWPALLRFGRLEAPAWLLPALLVIFWVGYVVKIAGLLYPYTTTVDLAWHADKTRAILSGHLAELYKPGAFSESVMPTNEWGANRPVIPYSPFFHIFSTIFAIFPWQIETSMNGLSVLADTSHTFLIAVLALKWGLRARVALLAALLYAVTPFTFLLHSWGNVPTTFGIWWTLVATVWIALAYERLRQPRVWTGLVVISVLTFLFYTVTAVFMGLFLVFLLVVLLIWGRALPRSPVKALASALVVASIAALIIYYGQYLGPIWQRTIPYLRHDVIGGQRGPGQDRIEPFATYFTLFLLRSGYLAWMRAGVVVGTLWYGIALPLALGLPGLWLLRQNRLALLIAGCWLAVGTIFFLLGTRISMVDKQVFYVVPLLVITAAAVLDRAWQRWHWLTAVLVLTYGATAASALLLWLIRLQRVTL